MKKHIWEYLFEWGLKGLLWGGTWLALALVLGIAGGITVKIGKWVYEIL
jgi:hypothetical protein